MDEVFESFELRLFDKLDGADHIIARIYTEGGLLGVDAEFRQQYIRERVTDIIDQIAEKREAKDGRKSKKQGK
ncbi:hypothetical protein [Paenibacillus rhizophilus]|uniref:Uncharacterized protein n=1 Tax=Paenibacillus rhizophilus TaxID=1850366 RepID=A0A3N9P3J8_9BACL|nr:hypothetical protein [Paenibacillus rhizophilus]RQW09940.1 hypothetical protein EH198_17825 [Paenibacillus rhizophilus]